MPKKKQNIRKIDIDQILLKGRQLFLFEPVSQSSAKRIIERLIALDKINKKPIVLWINSGGGTLSDGYAIIDTIKQLRAEVITIIVGEVCSMAGIISIVGDRRFMTEHAVWMSHDMAGGIRGDYTTKVLDRAKFLKKEQERLFNFLRKHTKLSDKELARAKTGELWFYAEDCKKKGIVDEVIK